MHCVCLTIDEKMTDTSVDQFVSHHLKLIDLDHNEEINQNKSYQQKLSLIDLQNRGICLIKLCKQSLRTGLYGRTVVTFGPMWSSQELPSNTISNGDIVGVSVGKDSLIIASGVVLKIIDTKSIDVAFDRDINEINEYEDNQRFNLIKLSNDVTHRRLKTSLNELNKSCHHLKNVLFGETTITDSSDEVYNEINYFNSNLNASQKDSIEFALKQKEVAIIHGPPGTGKTTVLIEFIMQCVCNYGLKVLATGPSNVSVDNLVEKLIQTNIERDIVRLGHPGRSVSHLHKYSLDAVIGQSDDYKIVCDMREELQELVTKRSNSYNEMKILRKDLKQRERKVIKQILEKKKVVLTTLTTGSPDGVLRNILNSDGFYPFDVIVIDECSQAIEASAWIVLNCGHKCVLAGDHCQLPPTIISEKAANGGLNISLMERLIKQFNDKQIVRMLDIQYRMNDKIMNWSSEQFYNNKLKANQLVKDHNLNDLIKASNIPPLVLIDTAGCDMNELDLEDEESKGNEYEADIVLIYVKRLIQIGFSQTSIGIISPYNLQVQLIRTRLHEYPKIEIKSVDGFQGREKEIIILSFVRSNDLQDIGFLSERRRINVAITRAKRHVTLICDSDTVCNDSTIKSLIDHFHENGDIICAQEFKSEMQNITQFSRPLNLRFKTNEINKSNQKSIQKQNSKQSIGNKKNEKSIITSNVKSIIQTNINEKLDEKRESEIEMKIQLFISDKSSNELSFPSHLSSYERLLVHKIAETFQLIHESVGEGNERYIIVKKKLSNKSLNKEHKTEKSIVVADQLNCDLNATIASGSSEQKNNWIKKDSVKSKTTNNESEKKAKKNNKSSDLKKNINLSADDDLDQMIAKVKLADNTCNYLNCKTNIVVLGQKCQFCGHRFCLKHAMPEIHGCGDKIRDFVRSNTRKDGIVYPGSGVIQRKPLDSHKRQYLEKKLNDKLNEKSKERKTKTKSEK
ncbi:DNA-binding protein SMUBP-2-like [Oppia nitens]|uniref:DNA-binding protein SMUBP-2-like n=1 Tax=Oppia nitens TaxID=1686743 RepID=UPI0023D98C4C|nr:DNA-binding protein SMUBP-2-like [Oppia nitens]